MDQCEKAKTGNWKATKEGGKKLRGLFVIVTFVSFRGVVQLNKSEGDGKWTVSGALVVEEWDEGRPIGTKRTMGTTITYFLCVTDPPPPPEFCFPQVAVVKIGRRGRTRMESEKRKERGRCRWHVDYALCFSLLAHTTTFSLLLDRLTCIFRAVHLHVPISRPLVSTVE